METDILIIDEALSVGDVFFQQKCYKRIDDLVDNGVTIVFVTHGMGAVEKYSKKVLFLDKGEQKYWGDSHEGVMRYYQLDRSQSSKTEVAHSKGSNSIPTNIAVQLELNTIDTTRASVIGDNELLKCTGYLVNDEGGRPKKVFCVGDFVVFEYEFYFKENAMTPVVGIEILNAMNQVIHAKNSMVDQVNVPANIAAGTLIRIKQRIKLDICPGEYTFNLNYFEIDNFDYKNAPNVSFASLYTGARNLFRVLRVDTFTVIERQKGVAVPFNGLVNLQGQVEISLVVNIEVKLWE
jgi:ABC-type glutathione transport system ATPase component